MSIFEAIIQGIIQGLTEFLPVSSSGHLTISQHIMGITDNNLFFNVMLHLGTLVAVCVFYRKLLGRLIKEFFSMVKEFFTGKFKWDRMNHDRNLIFMLIIGLLPLFLLFLPIPFTGIKVKDLADILMGDKYLIVVGIALIITSILLALGSRSNKKLERRYRERNIKSRRGPGRRRLYILDSLTIGITQFFAAIFPGLSRSGSTLAVGQMRGLNKQTALDYTFVLAVPSILAAAVLELKDAIKNPLGLNIEVGAVIVGVIVSAVVGYLSIKLFKWLLQTDKMYIFIAYTLIVGIIVTIISIIELSKGVNIFTGVPLKIPVS